MIDSPKSILIVEDEQALAQALQLKLSGAGFMTTVAADGQAALNILAEKDFDLIILDLVMPRVDGFGVLEQLQKRGKPAKVIVLSNLSQAEDIARTKKLGAAGYYVKTDYSLAAIADKVREHLADGDDRIE